MATRQSLLIWFSWFCVLNNGDDGHMKSVRINYHAMRAMQQTVVFFALIENWKSTVASFLYLIFSHGSSVDHVQKPEYDQRWLCDVRMVGLVASRYCDVNIYDFALFLFTILLFFSTLVPYIIIYSRRATNFARQRHISNCWKAIFCVTAISCDSYRHLNSIYAPTTLVGWKEKLFVKKSYKSNWFKTSNHEIRIVFVYMLYEKVNREWKKKHMRQTVSVSVCWYCYQRMRLSRVRVVVAVMQSVRQNTHFDRSRSLANALMTAVYLCVTFHMSGEMHGACMVPCVLFTIFSLHFGVLFASLSLVNLSLLGLSIDRRRFVVTLL